LAKYLGQFWVFLYLVLINSYFQHTFLLYIRDNIVIKPQAYLLLFLYSIEAWLTNFIAGKYQFSPLRQYNFANKSLRVWSYLDRLTIHLLEHHSAHLSAHYFFALFALKCTSTVKDGTDPINNMLDTQHIKHVFQLDCEIMLSSFR